MWSVVVAGVAAGPLWSGVYKVIERALIGLVVVMSVVILITAIIVRPDLGNLVNGFVPSLSSAALLTVVALVGTTVVPHNFFLHASSVQEKWDESVTTDRALSGARFDTVASIGPGWAGHAGGSDAAAAAFFRSGTSIEDAGTMATQLEPLLGPAATWFFAIGLLATGVSSAITAPLASSYAICGVLGWGRDLRSPRFRAVWAATLLINVVRTISGG